jgi:hypothetical protein
MANSREVQFQQDIIASMLAQGWLTGPAKGYDRRTALYTEDFLAYFKEAWPERWDKFAKANPNNPENVLGHGFKLPGVKVEACSFKPDHGMNPQTLARYQCNRLRVVQEVSYSPHSREGEYNPRLDLVLFVNGIPTATLELKSEFKQSVENAKRQYRQDRPLKDPLTRKPEPLLSFKRGALVHFAVSQDEVAMTTQLAGKETFFLPFNLGSLDGGAGNPPAPDDSQYATGYLWHQLLEDRERGCRWQAHHPGNPDLSALSPVASGEQAARQHPCRRAGQALSDPAQCRLRQVQLDRLDGAPVGLAVRRCGPAPVQLGDSNYRPHRAGQAAAGHHLPVRACPGRGQADQSGARRWPRRWPSRRASSSSPSRPFRRCSMHWTSTPSWPADAMQ